MDKIITLENQLRTISTIPPGALPKDNDYAAYTDFMKQVELLTTKLYSSGHKNGHI